MEAAKDENVTYKTPENAKEIAGHGSVITIDNSEILAGNKKLMAQYLSLIHISPSLIPAMFVKKFSKILIPISVKIDSGWN